jgi:tetratricopeptide (TPR) repeat protein
MLAPMRRRTKISLACLLGVALAVPAIAQSGTTLTQYPACPDPPPKLSKAEFDAAHAAYNVGMEAYAASDYQKALDNFKEAFRRDCSKVALLDFIARAYEGKGDRAEAIHALETYLQRNPKAPDAETFQTRIQNLRTLMQQQQPTVTASTATATATATATPTVTVTVVPSTTATAPPVGEVQTHSAGPWIVVVVGAAAAIVGGVLIGVGQSEYTDAHNSFQTMCPTGSPSAMMNPMCYTNGTLASKENSAVLVRGTGIAAASVGVAAIILGVVWHFAEPTGPKKVSLVPLFGPGFAGASFGVPF